MFLTQEEQNRLNTLRQQRKPNERKSNKVKQREHEITQLQIKARANRLAHEQQQQTQQQQQPLQQLQPPSSSSSAPASSPPSSSSFEKTRKTGAARGFTTADKLVNDEEKENKSVIL